MNGLLLVLFGGLAVAVIFAYLGGRQAGLGRGEQDRGDLAEENTALRKYTGGLEERVTAQHHRIVAMTAWETVPWPDGRTSPVPVRPRELPAGEPVLYDRRRPRDAREDPDLIGQILRDAELRVPRPRREKRTSTAAFLDPPPLAPAFDVPDDAVSRSQNTDPIERDGWWRDLEDEIWSARLWLAAL